MKLLSIVVPCYQSQDYMRHCVKTLLAGGEAVEILIVNDGSTDETGAIADALQAAHPTIIRAIHQENGGHGAAVMTGLRHATGQYFKVVDSDDWVSEDALIQALAKLEELASASAFVDMVVCNFVYDKVGVKHKTVMRYQNVLPHGKVETWDEIGRFRLGQYILMHSVIYRTALLRESGLELPRHTFYVDNLYVYYPLQYVKTLLYLDITLYHYFIGRGDQSVNEQVMIRRIDQQIYVNKLMLELVDLGSVQPPSLRRYMRGYLEIITVVSSILLYRAGTAESLMKRRALWAYIQQINPGFYAYLARGAMGSLLKHEGRFWQSTALLLYQITRRVVGFS